MKRLIPALILCIIFQSNAFASLELDDLNTYKENFYRLGTTDKPELKYNFEVQPEIKPVVQKEVTIKDSQNLTYADLSIKRCL